MTSNGLFPANPDDTRTEILEATYRALCEHGYDDLTIQKIGEQFGKSTSLVYHHYEGKDDLLVDFMGYMLERFEADVPFEDVEDPWSKLEDVLDHALAPTLDAERENLTSAMIELRAQAAHDPAYREAFSRHDRFFHDRLAAIVSQGIDQGVFREVDPERVAALLQTTFNGAMMQRVTTDPDDGGVSVEDVRAELEAVLEASLHLEDEE
ncbi:MAG: AcrR family transcriptional regulator [Halobacteriales archaeon]|jgi:AcrR family transcriptional regulator